MNAKSSKCTPRFSADDADLSAMNWVCDRNGYARRNFWMIEAGVRKCRYMVAHRVVLARVLGRKPTRDEIADHINGDRLDNRRENIRSATVRLNNLNVRRVVGSDRVTFHKRTGKWQAAFMQHRRCVYLGLFNTRDEAKAAAAFRSAEIKQELGGLHQ